MTAIQDLIDNFLYSIQEYNKDNSATLTKIIDQLEEISKNSHNLDYLSINNIALLLQDNLLSIFEEHQTLSDKEFELLKQWPELFDDYFNNRKIEATVDIIISNLQHSDWPIPIDENDSHILKELLLSSTDSNNQESVVDQQALLSTTFTTLVNTVSTIVGDNSQTLVDFQKKIEKICHTAELAGFIGFHDLCLMALDNISLLSEDAISVTDTQKTLITSWFGLAKKYLDNPSSKKYAIALVNNLSNSNWPSPIPHNDKTILLEILGIETHEDEPQEQEVKLSFVQTLTKLKNLILRFNDSKLRMTEINQSMQALINIASEFDLLGLQDICLLYQEILADFFSKKEFVSHEDLTDLAKYPILIQNYFFEPNLPENIDALLTYLQQPKWETSLSSEDAEFLKNVLSSNTNDASVHTLHGDIMAAAIEHNNVTNNITIPGDSNGNDDALAISSELVEMLLSEIQSIANEASEIFPSEDEPVEIQHERLSKYHLRIERFSNASQAAELTGLYKASNILLNNIQLLINEHSRINDVLPDLLKQWIITLTDYLLNLGDAQPSEALVSILHNELWKQPISPDNSILLIELLKKPYSETVAQDIHQPIEVSENDVSIEITDDINKDLLDGLLQELPGQVLEFSKAMQNYCGDSPNVNSLDKAQRIAHTIKGAANTVGIRGIAFLTHRLEDILSILKKNQSLPTAPLAESLIAATDCLEEMAEALLQSQSSPHYALEVLQNVVDWANLLATKGVDSLKMENESESIPDSIHALPSTEKKTTADNEDTAETQKTQTISIPINTIDNLLRLMGESMILNLQLHEKIQHSSSQTNNLHEHNISIRDLSHELERYIEMSGNSLSQSKAVNQSEVFDPLELEEYNELHTTSNRIVESATDAHEINADIETELKQLSELLFNQSNIQQEVYDLIMQSRMVPVSSIIPRLERCVRQTCRTTEKKAKLQCYGEDTLVDRNILNKMIDPLMHMIRNSIDHGIEMPEQRIANNKSETGTVTIKVNRVGTQIIFDFKDDGAGLDKQKIINIAKSKGILKLDDEISDQELYRLIIQPGFTTKEKTTQTSGRGIGMDVVYEQLIALNGTLSIESKHQHGIHFELRLPVSLINAHAVFIEYHKQLLAISNYNIIRILHPSDGEFVMQNGVQKLLLDDELLDINTIEYLLHSTNDNKTDTKNRRPGLLISYENTKQVVFINNIQDTRNIVIKDMGHYLKKINGVIGATIVGDGSVVPVLDLSDLIRTSTFSETSSVITLAQTSVVKLLPTVMIIDDSISTRRALSQVMKDAGYDIVTAKDGIEAIGIMEKKRPSIILVDFEMPRMNGIELTSHVRGIDDLKDIPIIMITSRTTDKHKNMAFDAGVNKYTIKPFSEDALLDDVAYLLSDDI